MPAVSAGSSPSGVRPTRTSVGRCRRASSNAALGGDAAGAAGHQHDALGVDRGARGRLAERDGGERRASGGRRRGSRPRPGRRPRTARRRVARPRVPGSAVGVEVDGPGRATAGHSIASVFRKPLRARWPRVPCRCGVPPIVPACRGRVAAVEAERATQSRDAEHRRAAAVGRATAGRRRALGPAPAGSRCHPIRRHRPGTRAR